MADDQKKANDAYSSLPVQTRSEKTGLRLFSTVKEALEFAQEDEYVEKISFSLGKERVILDRTVDDQWVLRKDCG